MIQASHDLTNAQRDQLAEAFNRDGYVVLPERLPADLHQRCVQAIESLADQRRAADPKLNGVKIPGCVDQHPVFRELMCYRPALQLAYDLLGPVFHLAQANCVHRPPFNPAHDRAGADRIGWHADGPRPSLFPRVNGAMGLHYLKFGYFLTDVDANGSPLQLVKGSHQRDELDGRGADFDIANYADDLVSLTCKAGTVVAFHQAQWHAAPPNQATIARANVYISYCHTWMRPLDRHLPGPGDNDHLDPVTSWLLHEWRDDSEAWWLPQGDDRERLAAYARQP